MKRFVFLAFIGLCLLSARGLAADAPSDDDKEGVILGTAIKRDASGWLGLELKGGTFQITFYNDKKKPVAADRSSAVLRWSVHYQPNPERTELVPTGDPSVLASSYQVKAPYAFKLHISLLAEGNSEVEGYVVDFNQ